MQAFRDSRFRQKQRVELAPGGSLALVDWITAGRAGFQGGGAGGFTSNIGGGVAPSEAGSSRPLVRCIIRVFESKPAAFIEAALYIQPPTT